MEKNNLTEEQLEAIKKVSEELISHLSKNDNTTPVLLREKKFEGEINEFDINPAQIFNDEYDMAKTYTDNNLVRLEMVANYIQLYQRRNNICAFPLEEIGDDKYFQKQDYYDNVSETRLMKKQFPFVKYYFTDFGIHSYFYGYDHILKRENNETIFDLLFCLKLNQIEETERFIKFLNYHQKLLQINDYIYHVKLLLTDYSILFDDRAEKMFEIYKSVYKPIVFKERSELEPILNSNLDDLISIIIKYFPDEENSIRLKDAFFRKEIKPKLFFNGGAATFYYLFIELSQLNLMKASNTDIAEWLSNNFEFQSSKEKKRASFKRESATKGLNKNRKSPKMIIDLSFIKKKLEI